MASELRDAWMSRDPLPADPMPVVAQWLDEAFAADLQRNPNAVALATVDPDGRPSARMVLCKGIDVARGELVFYSHHASRKGRALAAHPHAALVFYWPPQERQVRVEGPVCQAPAAVSDAYFASRPGDSQLGAWASAQSEPVASRAALERHFGEQRARIETAHGEAVPRPPGWGGYRVRAERVELWVSRPARLHDRAVWERKLGEGGRPDGPWGVPLRLQP